MKGFYTTLATALMIVGILAAISGMHALGLTLVFCGALSLGAADYYRH